MARRPCGEQRRRLPRLPRGDPREAGAGARRDHRHLLALGSRRRVRGCRLRGIEGAVRSHTKCVALYCAEQGLAIGCNAIHPGAIVTPIWEPMLGGGAARDAMLAELVAEVRCGASARRRRSRRSACCSPPTRPAA
jgi:hypothetical protein